MNPYRLFLVSAIGLGTGLLLQSLWFQQKRVQAPDFENLSPQLVTDKSEQPAMHRSAAPNAKNPTAPAQKSGALAEELAHTKHQLQTKHLIASGSAESVHHTPKATKDAASALGEVVAQEAAHPERKAEFLEFYRDCAYNNAIVTSIRVQCLQRFLALSGLSRSEKAQVVSQFSPAIQRLYQALESLTGG